MQSEFGSDKKGKGEKLQGSFTLAEHQSVWMGTHGEEGTSLSKNKT